MPTFQVTVVNSDFTARSELDVATRQIANCRAVKGALEVGTEQVVAGTPFYGAEVTVSDGSLLERFVVSIGVSALK